MFCHFCLSLSGWTVIRCPQYLLESQHSRYAPPRNWIVHTSRHATVAVWMEIRAWNKHLWSLNFKDQLTAKHLVKREQIVKKLVHHPQKSMKPDNVVETATNHILSSIVQKIQYGQVGNHGVVVQHTAIPPPLWDCHPTGRGLKHVNMENMEGPDVPKVS